MVFQALGCCCSLSLKQFMVYIVIYVLCFENNLRVASNVTSRGSKLHVCISSEKIRSYLLLGI